MQVDLRDHINVDYVETFLGVHPSVLSSSLRGGKVHPASVDVCDFGGMELVLFRSLDGNMSFSL